MRLISHYSVLAVENPAPGPSPVTEAWTPLSK